MINIQNNIISNVRIASGTFEPDVEQWLNDVPIVSSRRVSMATNLLMSCVLACATGSMVSSDASNQERCRENIIEQCLTNFSTQAKIHKARLRKTLDEISKLQAGWVDGGLVISPTAVEYVARIIDFCSEAELENWEIGPYPNGTIIMNYRGKSGKSSINIGKSTVSAFVKTKESYEIFQKSSAECFDAVIDIIRAFKG